MAEQLWPVYEFRPSAGFFDARHPVWRYDGTDFVEDDGEYGLAFAGKIHSAPVALYVDLPYQRNIIWSWCDRSWGDTEPRHPHSNVWHYALRDGTKNWGGDWGRDQHPNALAGRKAMNYLATKHGCANGRPIEFHPTDRHISAGLVRERATGEVYIRPPDIQCMYCGDRADAALERTGS